MTRSVRIVQIQGFAFRCPIANPIKTSFGVMKDRPAAFVRIEDQDGNFGWGEIFANWPAAAVEHRINLLAQDIAPMVLGHSFTNPSDLFERLTTRTHILSLQSGEWGPFRQVIAGLDIAMWDMFSRKQGQTLRHFLNPDAPDIVSAYSSGIHIKDAEKLITQAKAMGFSAFKIKIGFNMNDDLTRLNLVFNRKKKGDIIAVDANQGLTQETALSFISSTHSLPLAWLEEPICADAASAEWETLSCASPYPLAGGENIVGFDAFNKAIKAQNLNIIQPDIIKWGGITGCYIVARKVREAGLLYCPHFLGGGIGLHASANLLAAVGGGGMLEVDINPNPLRDAFGSVKTYVSDVGWNCNRALGIGISGLPDELTQFESHTIEIS